MADTIKRSASVTVSGLSHEISLAVRDYELDAHGIVNNANYLHYLEHARAEFCLHFDIDLHDYARRGLVFVLYKTELTFRRSLTAYTKFKVITHCTARGRTRLLFDQQIKDEKNNIYLNGRSIVVCVDESTGKSTDIINLLAQQQIIIPQHEAE